jgi:hypothetical protein
MLGLTWINPGTVGRADQWWPSARTAPPLGTNAFRFTTTAPIPKHQVGAGPAPPRSTCQLPSPICHFVAMSKDTLVLHSLGAGGTCKSTLGNRQFRCPAPGWCLPHFALRTPQCEALPTIDNTVHFIKKILQTMFTLLKTYARALPFVPSPATGL